MESNSQKRKRIKKEGAEKVYEDDTWLIVRPFTIEASNVYGTNTRWCTVSHIKPGTVDNIPESLFYGYIASGGVFLVCFNNLADLVVVEYLSLIHCILYNR